MSPQHAMQRLIIAGNALCAALEDEHQMPEDDRARVLSTWEVAVEFAKNSVPKGQSVWCRSGHPKITQ